MKLKALLLVTLFTLPQAQQIQALSLQEIQTWGTVVIAAPLAIAAAVQFTRRDEKTGHHRPLTKSGVVLLTLATAYVLLGAYGVKELASHLG